MRIFKTSQKPRRNKYNNIRDHEFDSLLEKQYAFDLLALQQAGEIRSYKHHVDYPLQVNGHHICIIEVDFEVVRKDGVVEVHEVKSEGTKTAVWNLKHKLFKALYPNTPYHIIQKGSFQRKGKFQRYEPRIIQVDKE